MVGVYTSLLGRNSRLLALKQPIQGQRHYFAALARGLNVVSYDPQDGPQEHKHPMMILHGLMGSASNFRSIARHEALAKGRRIALPDLRNHGLSPHANTMTLEEMSADVYHEIKAHALEPIHLVGHSLGGKVAMMLALTHPEIFKSLTVVDIAPVTYRENASSTQWGMIQHIVQLVHNAPVSQATSRKDIDNYLKENEIQQQGIRGFLLQNLVRSDDGLGFQWRVNTKVIAESLNDLSGFNENGSTSIPTLFIRGATSDYVQDAHVPTIKEIFPEMQLETIPNAGHWVHAENPQGFVKTLSTFVDKVESN
eukprot:gb/GECG01009557.1/.p1 GENE.gb/GECG01009557.1/~~gb/GECG01009557.1/.p1  ORF type:complete len:310 (+),score=25.93 gb/GECG01009557.1/:1-930(+)